MYQRPTKVKYLLLLSIGMLFISENNASIDYSKFYESDLQGEKKFFLSKEARPLDIDYGVKSCHSLNGKLYEPDSRRTREFVVKFVKDTVGDAMFYVGVYRSQYGDEFNYVENEKPLLADMWAYGEPSVLGKCVALDMNSMLWARECNENVLRFVCEVRADKMY